MDEREFLYRRRNRCVGQLLGQLEREIFPHLSQQQCDRVAALIKSKIGSYHSDVLDIMQDADGVQYNVIAMELKDRLNDQG